MSTFQALLDFKSREFNGTQYSKGLIYTIRPASELKLKKAGRKTLAEMTTKWLKAKLFTPNEDLEMLGATFKKGVVSYCLDDEFSEIVADWVDSGKADYTDGSLITFNITSAVSGITGED